MINYIESYSYMMLQMETEPAEKVQAHFFKVCIIGVANHRKLYDKYRHRFYEALARLVSSLAVHPEHFPAWIRKFVRRTFQETLKIPDAAIFGGESPEESLKDAISFWSKWLAKDKIWDEKTANQVYDELVLKIVEDIREVDLSYRVVDAEKPEGDAASDAPGNQVAFEAVNEKH